MVIWMLAMKCTLRRVGSSHWHTRHFHPGVGNEMAQQTASQTSEDSEAPEALGVLAFVMVPMPIAVSALSDRGQAM